MTRITIPDSLAEHHATEVALAVALRRIEYAEREAAIWRGVAIATTCIAILGVVAVTI
ncbi:hypothetical protein UFOVP681_27 [uncultured Caudovirales phage]|uniref:Uncharacterized protein n=1 Tax=uncultured Caudovirales phage TaxID=2100421 RepID=A0A6J5NJV5_9CAUD|nr:hypothetical protein UFOVP681_27 [uncultured Caudovirales phage]